MALRHRKTNERRVQLLVASVILLASSIWFFSARDARGRTARLTADAWYYHSYLPSLVFDHDLDFRDEFAVTKNWYRFGKTPTGRQANVFGIGPAVYELPFFLLGHGAAVVGAERANGFSRPEVEFSLYASLLFSLGALFFGARLVARRLGGRYGPLAIAALIAMGGPVVYYAIRQPGYAHPFATFWVAWLVDHWDKSYAGDGEPRSRRFWIGMGLLIGAASLARPQLVLWSVLGLYAAASDLHRAKALGLDRRQVARQVGRWLLGAVLAFLLVAPQLLAWKALYGSYIASPQGEGFMWWTQSAWLETLLSSRNGLLPWAPLYAIAAIGLFVGLRRYRRICSALLLGVFLQAYVNGAAWDWWGGGAFGGRRFDSCYVAFVFGLGVVLVHLWGRHEDRSPSVARKLIFGVTTILVLLLAVANTRFASTQSAPTVRIHGGNSASAILRRAPGPLGMSAGAISAWSNLPVRAVFSWRHDTSLDAYDRIVGVHQLGELYPGLNSFRGKKTQRLNLDPGQAGVIGLMQDNSGKRVAPSGRASLLIGLNRRGPIRLVVRVDSTVLEPRIWMGDRELEIKKVSQKSYQTEINAYERGSNRITIRASKGFRLDSVELSSQVNAAGQVVTDRF